MYLTMMLNLAGIWCDYNNLHFSHKSEKHLNNTHIKKNLTRDETRQLNVFNVPLSSNIEGIF